MSNQRKHNLKKSLKEQLWILPASALITFLTVYALIFNVSLSFHKYPLYSKVRPFVGAENFATMFGDPTFWASIIRSLKYTLSSTALAFGLGLALALLLNTKIKFKGLFRSLFLVPWVLSMVSAGILFKWFFQEPDGLINKYLVRLGIGTLPWFSDPSLAFGLVVAVYVWKMFPFAMVVLLAALQVVPEELHEAARIDGAGMFKRFIYITTPILRSPMLVLVIILSLWAFNTIDLIYVMTEGGPGEATNLASYLMYQYAFNYWRLGYAATMGIFLFVININLTLLYIRVFRPEVYY
jgi:multiple sugar transport system permease protein